jgi:hypothetical protein
VIASVVAAMPYILADLESVVDELRWKGKLDEDLFKDAASRGFDGLVVLDVDQLADPDLCNALAGRRGRLAERARSRNGPAPRPGRGTSGTCERRS